jgi:starch phosphorylase
MSENITFERILEGGGENGSSKEKEPKNFFEAIGRPDIKDKLTIKNPWVYLTMELYGEGLQGGGGLGILAADTLETFKKLNIPSVFITPFYPKKRKRFFDGFRQETMFEDIKPQEAGFKPLDFDIKIKTIFNGAPTETKLEVYEKGFNNSKLLILTEENFGYLYQDENSSNHRLYQETSLGFGSFYLLKKLEKEPSVLQLNESPTVFGALAYLDDLITQGLDLEEAMTEVRKKTIYTNHTLVQAAESNFSRDQFERYVFTNIKNKAVINWVLSLFDGDFIKLSSLAIALSSKRNGVSLIHAREANKNFKGPNNENPEFTGLTNGISIEKWANKKLLDYYRQEGIFGNFDLLPSDFEDKIENLNENFLIENKNENRRYLRGKLKEAQNQYGESINIPEDAHIFVWKRRIAGYKRPGLIFKNPEKLAQILESSNSYLIMAGETHPNDEPMKQELERILKIANNNEILRKRVHFLSNYNEEIARCLSEGADVSINTPKIKDESGRRISTEACGTSWEKDVINNTILISVSDGGVADWEILNPNNFDKPFLEIKGESEDEEADSLYSQMFKAVQILNTPKEKIIQIKKQLKAYLSIISDSRMARDYLEFEFKS